jgi:hypothetical protein
MPKIVILCRQSLLYSTFTYFHESRYQCYAMQHQANTVNYNFLRPAITTYSKYKLVRWE